MPLPVQRKFRPLQSWQQRNVQQLAAVTTADVTETDVVTEIAIAETGKVAMALTDREARAMEDGMAVAIRSVTMTIVPITTVAETIRAVIIRIGTVPRSVHRAEDGMTGRTAAAWTWHLL